MSDAGTSQNQWSSVSGIQFTPTRTPIVKVVATTATIGLDASNNGTTFIVPAMSNTCAVSLPANALGAGMSWKFQVNGTVGNAMTLTAATATTIKGVLLLSGGIVIKTAATTTVITATAVAGDVMTIYGDGTNWYINAVSSAAAGFS